MVGPLVAMLTMVIVVAAPIPVAPPEEGVVAHYRFESAAAQESSSAVAHAFNAGDLLGSGGAPNRGSFRFDGAAAIVATNVRSDDERLTEGFTWEGFFFSPSANRIETDGAIADRFITQFVDDEGKSTRLTIGLSAPKKDGKTYLCVAMAGTSNRHVGTIPVIAGGWRHFALVHHPADEQANQPATLTWYLDHEPCGKLALTGKADRYGLKAPGKAPITIGARSIAGGKVDRGFQGLLDEIRLHAEPLTPESFLRTPQADIARRIGVDFHDQVPADFAWDFTSLVATESIPHEALAFAVMPQQYSGRGFETPRWGKQAVRATHEIVLPVGRVALLLRVRTDTLLRVDGRTLIDARFPIDDHPLGSIASADRDYFVEYDSDGRPHRFELSALYDANGDAETLGDVLLCYRPDNVGPWRLLGSPDETPLSAYVWEAYKGRSRSHFQAIDTQRLQAAIRRGDRYWKRRHEAARDAVRAIDRPEAPADGNPVDALVEARLRRRNRASGPIVDDAGFLRRLSLDVRGRIPTRDEVVTFLADRSPGKRIEMIDRLLESDEWADHWVGYWQDLLAENPSILKPTLNNSGPFRRWIRESFRDNVPLDRFATELIMMEGAAEQGGTAGFAIASNNDAPMAMKAHVVLKAFLAVDLKCARCHDSPHDDFGQRDLFAVAAMLNDRPLTVPASSVLTTPPGGRIPNVTSSLKAEQAIAPDWPFHAVVHAPSSGVESTLPARPRTRLASIVTAASNERFAQVFVNRLWKRYFGAGLVEPVDQWPDASDDLLGMLGIRFVDDGYDVKALARLLLRSDAYQRQGRDGDDGSGESADGVSNVRRRLSAEQIVDSLFVAVGKRFDAEELTFDLNRTRGFLNLGVPERAWQLASLSNERDRPALAMPVNQSIVDVLTVFGWRETRADPISEREESPNALQPLMLANGVMASRVVRLTDDCAVTERCLEDLTVERLVDDLFLSVLSRPADDEERADFIDLLTPGFEQRKTGKPKPAVVKRPRIRVDWDKHLQAEATLELMEAERRAREGSGPTVRLTADFRERVEDALWALINSPEFVFVP